MAMQYKLALFNPLSYDEIVKPLIQLTELLHLYEDTYNTLSALAEILRERAVREQKENPNSEWTGRYLLYADELQNLANILASQGLNPSSRQALSKMKVGYGTTITPIERAIARLQEIIKTLSSKNPAASRMVYGDMPSIDALIENPNLDRIGYSGADVEKSAMLSAGAASARNAINQFARDPKNIGYMLHLKLSGYSAEAFNQLLQEAKTSNDPNVNILALITDLVKQLFNNFEGVDNASKRLLEGEILSGLFKGIAFQDNTLYQLDAVYLENLRHLHLLNLYNKLKDAAKAAKMKMYNINPTSLYSTAEVEAKNKVVSDQLDSFKTKNYFDDKGQLTVTGMKALLAYQEYKDKMSAMGSGMNAARGLAELARQQIGKGTLEGAELYNWAVQNGLTIEDIKAGKASAGLNNAYRTTRLLIQQGLLLGIPNIDVYRMPVKDTNTRQYIAEKIQSLLGDEGKIYLIGNLTTSNGVSTLLNADGLNAKDFLKKLEKTPILHVINSPTTNLQLVELVDGTKYIIPSGVLDNINAENISDANIRIQNASRMGNIAETALQLNNANSYLGSILNYTEGTGIKPNDGTITFNIQ